MINVYMRSENGESGEREERDSLRIHPSIENTDWISSSIISVYR